MLSPIDKYYLDKTEPFQSCLQSLRKFILATDPGLEEKWRYGMPFFYYHGKMSCYLWIDKKSLRPYLGIVEGKHIQDPALESGKRSRMKILMVDPHKDLPVKKIGQILRKMIRYYKTALK
ncbi:MAG: DUF1801 domain-containing protein [Chitinophagales bacterium]